MEHNTRNNLKLLTVVHTRGTQNHKYQLTHTGGGIGSQKTKVSKNTNDERERVM